MPKRNLATVFATGVAAALLVLSGCSATETPSAGGDPQAACDISLLTFQSPALPASFWEGQMKKLGEQFPNLKVDVQYTPGLDRQAYATQLLAAGTLPDIIWDVPLQEFVKAKALLPYDEAEWAKLGMSDDVGRIDGKHYSLAIGSQPTPMMFYNADVFDELGLSEPKTYAELVDVAAAIKAAGKTPFLIGGGSDPWTSTMLLGGIINTDVLLDSPDWVLERAQGKVKFTDANFKAAVTKWEKLVKAGYMNSDAMALGYDQLIAKFMNQEGVMYPMGAWAAAQESTFKTGVFALPTNDGKEVVLGNTPAAEIYLSAKTKCPAQAQAFAMAIAHSEDFATAWLKADALLPQLAGYKIPADISPLITKTIEVLNTDGIKITNPWGWMNGERALPAGFVDEFNKGAQVVFGGGSVADFLTQMDKVFDDLNTEQ